MGGILGMYVSFSFLVIFEIFEIIARSVISALHAWRAKRQTRAAFLGQQTNGQRGPQQQMPPFWRNQATVPMVQTNPKTVSFF
ncbi:hypothetical protein IscW_ISCW004713 [Ixodes scapularis]|uniref:Uncharacterized protein n=2 Tax=Ixodes scapularis TaxID=6945 RepID=B7PG69_IXOSC|nr:hypothetical protein IscW_ISCW004713 [Ixodes scapularis]|eukprot:XP_002434193.1 hypothetical protein IscW_ISCW004713 [Ixodes scapularis]